MAIEIREVKEVSVVRACRIVMLELSMYYYSSIKDDSEVKVKLCWYDSKYPTSGLQEYFKRIPKKVTRGKPMQNGYIERFNRTYREDVLDATIFKNLKQVREKTEKWMEDYNENHPNSSLADLSPWSF